jgi:starch synthase (maltosyl-transferring)
MGQKRVVIESVSPQVNGGKFSVKRVVGEPVVVEADIFGDGHQQVYAELLFREEGADVFRRIPMKPIGNDRWSATFIPERLHPYEFTVEAWIDHVATWQHDLKIKQELGQEIEVDLLFGARLLEDLMAAVKGKEKKSIQKTIDRLSKGKASKEVLSAAFANETVEMARRYHPEKFISRYEKVLRVEVSRKRALFSSWYEFFPRSAALKPHRHGTFKDCLKILPQIAEMGFDVVYFPPIHPIGLANRKGKNNAVKAVKGEPGSPWAIGSAEGGHDAIHSELGSLDDFKVLLDKAEELGMEIALDLAFQCSPDHPYVKEHPEWFIWRPDGRVQYAENPPKKYEDIIPINFECENWQALWQELLRVVLHWVEAGIRVFRVDNPHTKPFCFWQWLIAEVKKKEPEVIFLSEAFTRPKVMGYLAKVGFDQSYTYFTWRNSAYDLRQYLNELTQSDAREYFRPNFWPNTPDILPQDLQYGGKAAFVSRLVLAATLSSNYGIYGPCFEKLIHEPTKEGKEEYKHSEKYEIKFWEKREGELTELITLVNKIRKENPALQTTWNLRFVDVDNDKLIGYLKGDPEEDNLIFVVVSLDFERNQSGMFRIPLEKLNISPDQQYFAYDLLSGDRHVWQDESVRLDFMPSQISAHIFRLHTRMRREHQFDYFM